MKIKLVKHWEGHRPGAEITPGDGVANVLIRRGIAVRAEADPPPPPPAKSNDQSGWRRQRR